MLAPPKVEVTAPKTATMIYARIRLKASCCFGGDFWLLMPRTLMIPLYSDDHDSIEEMKIGRQSL
jgi:hypothetical protein